MSTGDSEAVMASEVFGLITRIRRGCATADAEVAGVDVSMVLILVAQTLKHSLGCS